MKIHEYQAKAILARHGVAVPRGEVAFNASEVADIARRLGGGVVVVKAQIHAGGRGKAGGVKIAKDKAAVRVGRGTDRQDPCHPPDRPKGPNGRRLLIEEGLQMAKELYLRIVVDRRSDGRC